MIVYHGTRNATSILRDGFTASAGGEFGPGLYLTESIDSAKFWGGVVARGPEDPAVLRATFSPVNPMRITKVDWIRLTQRVSPRAVHRRWAKRGHDAVFGVGINGIDVQVVAFDPSDVTGAELFEVRSPSGEWLPCAAAEPPSAAALREAIGRLDAASPPWRSGR